MVHYQGLMAVSDKMYYVNLDARKSFVCNAGPWPPGHESPPPSTTTRGGGGRGAAKGRGPLGESKVVGGSTRGSELRGGPTHPRGNVALPQKGRI